MIYFQNISMSEYIHRSTERIDFCIKDLEEISYFFLDLNNDDNVDWGICESTQDFNIQYWTKDSSSIYHNRIKIFKSDDDWFLVEIYLNDYDPSLYFKIDQLDGLIKFFEYLFSTYQPICYRILRNKIQKNLNKNFSYPFASHTHASNRKYQLGISGMHGTLGVSGVSG